MRICSIKGCERKHKAKGWCKKHYKCFLRTGDPIPRRSERARARKAFIKKAIRSYEPRGCKIEGCDKNHKAKGYCRHHYESLRVYGDPLAAKQVTRKCKGRICTHPECDRPMYSKEYCHMHYERMLNNGSLKTKAELGLPLRGPAIPVDDRFRSYLSLPDKNGCIKWVGSLATGGYGAFFDGKRAMRAHRFSYIRAYGPIPKRSQIHHTCKNRWCVNPLHLAALTTLRHSHIHLLMDVIAIQTDQSKIALLQEIIDDVIFPKPPLNPNATMEPLLGFLDSDDTQHTCEIPWCYEVPQKAQSEGRLRTVVSSANGAGLCETHVRRYLKTGCVYTTGELRRAKHEGRVLKQYFGEIKPSHPPICTHPGCNEPYSAKGYCKVHYHRHRTGIPMDKVIHVRPKCSEPECDQPHEAKGYCKRHYQIHVVTPRKRARRAAAELQISR